MSKRTIVALIVALGCFGSVYATASSLGGVTSSSVSADNVAITACDSDGVTTSYATAWDSTDKRYEVTTVTVGGVADTCDGQTLSVSLKNASGTQIGSGSVAIPSSVGTSHTVTLSTAPSAALTEGIDVLIAS